MFLTAKHNKFKYRYKWTAYLMILPALVLLGIFVFAPLAIAVYRSFLHSDTGKFVGFFNFYYVLQSTTFLSSFGNVLIMSSIITVAMILLSFGFAHVVKNIHRRLGAVVKVSIFLPYLISLIIASVVFLFMLNYGGGLFNSILVSLGRNRISFATEGLWPYISIIIPSLWLGFGYNTFVMLAGLLSIPKSYYEAAEMDGANTLAKLFYITVPSMKNYFLLLLISLTSGGLQMFELPLMITQGGPPVEKTTTPILFLVNNFKGDKPQNTITAGALLVMMVISIINFFVFKVVNSEKSQDA